MGVGLAMNGWDKLFIALAFGCISGALVGDWMREKGSHEVWRDAFLSCLDAAHLRQSADAAAIRACIDAAKLQRDMAGVKP